MAKVPVVLIQALMSSMGLADTDLVQKIEINQTGVVATVFLTQEGQLVSFESKFGPVAATYTVFTEIDNGADAETHTHGDGTTHTHAPDMAIPETEDGLVAAE